MRASGSLDPFTRNWERYFLRSLSEGLVFCAVVLLLLRLLSSPYGRYAERMALVENSRRLVVLVRALEQYTLDRPDHVAFPPGPYVNLEGYVLCPLRPPHPQELVFLTTPIAYLSSIPVDPYVTRLEGKGTPHTPVVLHWVRVKYPWQRDGSPYEHHAWGALSVGPSLALPPRYDLTVLRRVPYERVSLRGVLYSPSNGLRSLGLLYYDSLGNHSDF